MRVFDAFIAVRDNDVAKVAEILEMLNLKKDGTNPRFTSQCREVMTLMLGAASAVAAGSDTGHLEYDLAMELVERTAKVVDIFKFLQLVATAMRFENESYDIIPKPIRSALDQNSPSYAVEQAIGNMDPDAFEAMASLLLSDGFNQLNVSFTPPIIRYVYENQIVSDDLLFAFMAACPRRTVEEFLLTINPLDILAMLHPGGPQMGDDENEDSSAKGADETPDDNSGGGWTL